jgi:hypothetical protein
MTATTTTTTTTTDKPLFPLGMSVWINAAGILRPDQADGRPPWYVHGIRAVQSFDDDTELWSLSGWKYFIGRVGNIDYGWVEESELVKAEYTTVKE